MPRKYSLIVENDRVIAVEIDGVRYKSVDDIPDEEDRSKMFFLVESWPGEEWETPAMAAKPFLLPKLIVPLFLAVAVLMLGIALWSGLNTRRTLAREVTTAAEVVNLTVRQDSEGKSFYYPVVDFCLPDETCQTAELSSGSSSPSYRVGQDVTVAYDPQSPSQVRVPSLGDTVGRYTVTIIAGSLGLAFAAATLLARWVLKQEPDGQALSSRTE